MMTGTSSHTQSTQLSEKCLSIKVHDPLGSSNDQFVDLIEAKLQEAVDKQMEKIRRSIQNALQKQFSGLSSQLEHIKTPCKSEAKHACQEREAVSTSAKRNAETMEVACDDLKALRIQHMLALKNLSIHLEASLEECEKGQTECPNEYGKHFVEALRVQERSLADWEVAPSIGSDNSSLSTVLARVDQLEKTLEHTIDLQPKVATATAHVEDLSKNVNTCLEKVQEFQREINSSVVALQENVQCLELKVMDVRQYADACVGNMGNQVDLCSEMCSEMMGLKDADQENSIARLDQGLSELSSHLDAAVSELGCRISAQQKLLINVAKAAPQQGVSGARDDELMHMPKCDWLKNHKPASHFSWSAFPDLRSIGPQPSGRRSSTELEFSLHTPLRDSWSTGSLRLTPSPILNASAQACRIGGLTWSDQDKVLEVFAEERTCCRTGVHQITRS